MKKTYVEAELEVIELVRADIVTMSTPYSDGGDDNGWGGEWVE